MEYFKLGLRQFAQFTGRSTRKEFWMFMVFYLIFNMLAKLLGWMLNIDFISPLYSLILLLPCLSIAARRLHDIGKSGWWQLLYLIPIIGTLVLIYFYVQESQGNNQYDSNLI